MEKKLLRNLKKIFYKKTPKIFGIGANKTGSSSLAAIFKKLNYVVASQVKQEKLTTLDVQNRDFRTLKNFINKYHFFQDKPFSEDTTYITVDAMFPKSKFILTVRDSEQWFESMKNFHLKLINKANNTQKEKLTKEDLENFSYIEEGYWIKCKKFSWISEIDNENKSKYNYELLYNKEHYIKLYEQRNQSILKYFQNKPEDLLVLNVSKEQDISRILNFLKISKDKNFPFPKISPAI